MRQLLPIPVDDVDPLDLYLADARPSPPDRPWVLCNMIASADGATARQGRSGGLGGPADRAVFRALRASCDWVLVGSGTAVAERYHLPTMTDAEAARRGARGRSRAPRLAIVTASGKVDPTIPAFAERPGDTDAPLVIAGANASTTALDALDATVVRLPEPTPEPGPVLSVLNEQGATVVLCEGGPVFNGLLHAAGVIDELCVTLSPQIVGGPSDRIVAGAPADAGADLHLARLLEADGMLFARYVVR